MILNWIHVSLIDCWTIRETPILLYANNKDTDQRAHPRILTSALVL